MFKVLLACAQRWITSSDNYWEVTFEMFQNPFEGIGSKSKCFNFFSPNKDRRS